MIGETLCYAMKSAEIRARGMARRIGGLESDVDDIRQDLLVSVLCAKYDASRSCPKTFISRVMDKSGMKIIRKRMTRMSRIVPLVRPE